METRGYGALLFALLLVGCGDDDPVAADGAVPDAGVLDARMDDGSVLPDAGPGRGACEPLTLEGRIDPGAWDARFTIAGLTGYDGFTPSVRDLARDTDGSLLAAGYFVWAGRERVGALARLRDDRWEPARSDVPVDLSAVAVADDGTLAVASFLPLLPVLPPVPQRGEILVDSGSGLEAVGAFEGAVRSLAWVGDTLWVAGRFQLDDGPANLAIWDGATWSAPPGGEANGPVYALLVDGASVLVGGSFTEISGTSAQSVAEWNGSSFGALDLAGFEPTPYGVFQGPIVYGLARGDDGMLYAGGVITPPGSPTAGGVARWTGSAWEILGEGFAQYGGFAGDLAAVVSDVAIHDGELYATGCFTRSGETEVPGVARWSGTAWEPPAGTNAGVIGDLWFSSFVCGGEPSGTAIFEADKQRLYSDGARLFVGGQLPGVGDVPSKSLIAYDGTAWLAQGDTTGLGLVGAATELAVGGPDCAVYAIGATHAGSASFGSAYRFDGSGWSAVTAPRPEGVVCSQLAVSPEGDLYMGCETPWTDTPPVPRVYRLEGDAWVALPEIPSLSGTLLMGEMAFDHAGQLWVAGGLGESGFLARWDGEVFELFEDGLNGDVMALAVVPDDGSGTIRLLVGGIFTEIDGTPANRVALWDGERWQALGDGLATPVLAVAYAEGAIYASATYGDEGTVHTILGRWDGSSWEELGTESRGLPPHADPEGRHQIYALWGRGDHVIAAGSIYPDAGGRNVFVFDGERFAPLGGGVGAISVDALAVTPDALWFGGSIATTGLDDGLAPSVGIARYGLASP